MSRSKRLCGVANAAPFSLNHRGVAGPLEQRELPQAFVLLLLVPNLFTHHFFITARPFGIMPIPRRIIAIVEDR